MSYDLGVWHGPRPHDDEAAAVEYEKWCDASEEDSAPASAALTMFVNDLLTHYPDLGQPGDDASPWASGPLLADAVGDFMYINMTFDGAERGCAAVAEAARQHSLVVYDPQEEKLL